MGLKAIGKVNDAHDKAARSAQDLQFITEFLQHVAEDIEDASRVPTAPADIFEYGDRLRFLITLLWDRQKMMSDAADLLDAACVDLRSQAGLPPIQHAAD